MGAFPARIVAADFLTPPEFAAWTLPAVGAGRVGGARLSLAERGGSTCLTHVYEQVPVRVFPLDLGPTEPALIYLLNPTAGLLDGDAHQMELQVGAGVRAVVTGQSATRIHPCKKSYCTQQWNLSVADGAVLVVLPGPAIPFAGSRFFQRIHIHLGKQAKLVWGDVWFAGRYARQQDSEWFRFEAIIQDMQVFRAGTLVFRDRFHWHGRWDEATARWHFAGQPAAGMIFITGNPEMPIANEGDIAAAVFTTAAGDTCVRCTGPSESVTRRVVGMSLSAASALAHGTPAAPWLVRNHHLGRTHWFDLA